MNRNNTSSDDIGDELRDLVIRYEKCVQDGCPAYFDGDQLAAIADKYATDRDFDKAQEVICYGLKMHPSHPDLLIEQAYLYLDTNQLAKAKQVAESIVDCDNPVYRLLQAEIMLNEGLLDEAREILDSIEDKSDLHNIIDVVYLYVDMGYPGEALPWVESGMNMYADNESFLAVACDCFRNIQGMSDRAIELHNKLIDMNPYNPAYWTGLSKCYFSADNFEQAIEAADFALAADETFGEAHVMRAHSFFQLNNLEETVKEYEASIVYKSFTPVYAYLCIGLAYCNHTLWEKALEVLNKAWDSCDETTESPSILFDIHYHRTYVYMRLEQPDKALQESVKARSLSPADANICLLQGVIHMMLQEYGQAQEAWKTALTLSPDSETMMQVGDFSLEHQFVEQALRCYEAVFEQNPDYPAVPEKIAVAHLMLGHFKEFYLYNQLSAKPMEIHDLYDVISKSADQDFLKDFERFIREQNLGT